MPTSAERAWMDAIVQIGCVVCLIHERLPGVPGAVHHILDGGRRRGHLDTICLCDPGHHKASPTPNKISRHPSKTRFELAYGSEEALLATSRKLVRERHGIVVRTALA